MSTHSKSFLTAILLIVLISVGLNAAIKPKSALVSIETSANYPSCKVRIETVLNSTKGVHDAALNIAEKIISVSYDPTKISQEQIRELVAKTGCL